MTHDEAVATHAAERYLLGEMPELERFLFEAHYFACATCAGVVRAGALLRDGVAEGLLGAPAQDRSPEAENDRLTPDTRPAARLGEGVRTFTLARVLPWAVAATLAVSTGYQALVVVPELRDRVTAPQALAPLTLRGAARGAEPALRRPAAGVAAFAVDLPGVPPGTVLTYDLRAADGVSVASGTADAPPPGVPLLLLVPATSFPASGGYTLSVAAQGSGPPSAEYRFTLTER